MSFYYLLFTVFVLLMYVLWLINHFKIVEKIYLNGATRKSENGWLHIFDTAYPIYGPPASSFVFYCRTLVFNKNNVMTNAPSVTILKRV